MKTTPFLRKLLRAFTILLFSLHLSSCGGGIGAAVVAALEGGGGGTGAVLGTLAGFGSVFVNGVEFDTSNAEILINGEPASESELRVGMVIKVDGEISEGRESGTATQITFDSDVRGPIQHIEGGEQAIPLGAVVMGQTVVINEFTVLDGVEDFEQLAFGNVVIVSGLVNANRDIFATYIAIDAEVREFEVSGVITNLRNGAQTFELNELVVDFSSVAMLDVPGGVLENGLHVEVMGNLRGTLPDGVLVADTIQEEAELLAPASGTIVGLAGFVTRFMDSSQFEVARQPIQTNAETVFLFGEASDIALNVQLEVEGRVNANGILVAEEIAFLDAASQRTASGLIDIEADLEAVDSATGAVTLLGLSVLTNKATQFRDRLGEISPFNLQSLRIGDRLQMKGFLDLTDNSLIAEALVRVQTPADGQVVLEGPTASFDDASRTLNILDIAIVTDNETLYFRDTGTEQPITAERFFELLQANPETLVEAQGFFSGGMLTATRLEFEEVE